MEKKILIESFINFHAYLYFIFYRQRNELLRIRIICQLYIKKERFKQTKNVNRQITLQHNDSKDKRRKGSVH